jgi:hypothetical protein
MQNVNLDHNERNLRLALEPYKGKLATFQKIVKEFEAIRLEDDELRNGKYRIVKKSEYGNGDFFGPYPYSYDRRKVLKVVSRHAGFKAKLVGWDSEEYRGGGSNYNRWRSGTTYDAYGDQNWNVVWLHFETTTDIGLPFHTPLNLAVQNGKTASVWQDQLVEFGLEEGVDFKYNQLGDMLVLSDLAKDAIEYVTPPKPMVIQFDAQVPIVELAGDITAYWEQVGFKKNVKNVLRPRFRTVACPIGIELV